MLLTETAGSPASQRNEPKSKAGSTLDLWAWRRTVADLYGRVRQMEPQAGWALWRQTRDALFASHPQSPLEAGDPRRPGGLPFFAYDPALRFTVALQPAAAAPPLHLELGADGGINLAPFARTQGLAEALGAELTLFWIGGYGGGVFLPFSDATSGRDTYGAGRYLLDTIKGADLGQAEDGRVILDFNFAYNPSCSYSDRWSCPLAPPDNALPAAVQAGEKSR